MGLRDGNGTNMFVSTYSSNQIESALCMFSLFHNKCAYESCSLWGNDRHHIVWYTVKRFFFFCIDGECYLIFGKEMKIEIHLS